MSDMFVVFIGVMSDYNDELLTKSANRLYCRPGWGLRPQTDLR